MTQFAGRHAGLSVLVRGVQSRGKEVGGPGSEKENLSWSPGMLHATGSEGLPACLPAVRAPHVAQEDGTPKAAPATLPTAKPYSAGPTLAALLALSGSAESVPLRLTKEEIRSVCMVCKVVYANPEGRFDSHGLCPDHFEKTMADIRRRRAEREAAAK